MQCSYDDDDEAGDKSEVMIIWLIHVNVFNSQATK